MKQIAFASHAFYDAHKTLPTPKMIHAKSGKVIELSWRVSILPFLEEQALFAEFDQAGHWNSLANLPLAKSMPAVYEDALHGAPDAQSPGTYFQYFTGPKTLWPANAPVVWHDITDGSSSTFLFAEGPAEVRWTKPEDIVVLPDRPIPLPLPLGREGGWFVACMVDGSTRVITTQVSEATIRQVIDPRDGAVLPPDFF